MIVYCIYFYFVHLHHCVNAFIFSTWNKLCTWFFVRNISYIFIIYIKIINYWLCTVSDRAGCRVATALFLLKGWLNPIIPNNSAVCARFIWNTFHASCSSKKLCHACTWRWQRGYHASLWFSHKQSRANSGWKLRRSSCGWRKCWPRRSELGFMKTQTLVVTV